MTEHNDKRKSIYVDMRCIVGLDLTRNEAKVLTIYRMEMDEATRQVRGKSQQLLRDLVGLSDKQFSVASASLCRRGLIDVHRLRNAPQTVTLQLLDQASSMHLQWSISGTPEMPKPGTPGFPKSGNRNSQSLETETPEYRGDDTKSAPESAPESAPQCAAARLPEVSDLKKLSDRLHAAAGPCLSSQAIAPGLASMMVPQMWIDQGCDIERDVLPVLETAVARGRRNISSWDYWTKPVAEARARRLAGLPSVELAASGPFARKRLDLSQLVIVDMPPEARQ